MFSLSYAVIDNAFVKVLKLLRLLIEQVFFFFFFFWLTMHFISTLEPLLGDYKLDFGIMSSFFLLFKSQLGSSFHVVDEIRTY